jgi:hypothetical protein
VCCRSEMRRHPAHVLARAQNVTTLQTSFQRDVRLSDLDIGYALDFFACHISAPAASTLTLLFRGYPSALFPIRHLHPVVLSIATSKGFPHISLACFTLPSTQFRLSQRHSLALKQSTFTYFLVLYTIYTGEFVRNLKNVHDRIKRSLGFGFGRPRWRHASSTRDLRSDPIHNRNKIIIIFTIIVPGRSCEQPRRPLVENLGEAAFSTIDVKFSSEYRR